MIRRKFLETILKKGGLTDAEITDALTDIDTGQIDDTRAGEIQAVLLTEDEAAASDKITTRVKQTAKAEVLDGVDAILRVYEPKLTTAQKTDYTKLGKDTNKKAQFLLKAFDDKGTLTGDDQAAALQAELDELRTSTVPKGDYENVSAQVSVAQRRATHADMIVAARLNPRLRDVNADRHFKTNLIADAEALLAEGLPVTDKLKVKGMIDYATGELRKAEKPDEPILLNGRKATVNDLVTHTIAAESYGWGKSSDVPGSTVITTEVNAGGNKTMSRAARANLDDDNE